MATTIYSKLAAGETAFTSEEQVGEYVVTYPFGAAEPTAIVDRQPHEQFRAKYARPAANTTLSYGGVTLYFITDENFTDRRASLMHWDRIWASVPASFYEPEEFVYLFPGFTGAGTYGTTYAITGIVASGANYVMSTATSSGIAAGDTIFINASFTRGGQKYTQSWNAVTIVTTNYSQASIASGFLGSGSFTSVSGTISKSVQSRATARSFVVGSLVLSDFALSSPSALDTDLPLIQPFNPVDNTGAQVSVLTSTTAPTAASYAGLITSGGQIVVESTRRRYMGNIFQRTTRSVPAL
jgi:hypothetical protein